MPDCKCAQSRGVDDATEPKRLDFDSPPAGHFGKQEKQERSELQDSDPPGERLRDVPDEFRTDRAEQEEAAMGAARFVYQSAQ